MLQVTAVSLPRGSKVNSDVGRRERLQELELDADDLVRTSR
jgi:hypothetical protein